MAAAQFDVIVVGAGIEGSATAYHLARDGYRTLLLEQFTLPHSRGSSHGQTRITRVSYGKDCYASMMPESFKRWSQLEKETGLTLYKKSGVLVVGKGPSTSVNNTAKMLKKYGSQYQRLDGQKLKEKFPLLRYGPDFEATYEVHGGTLRADRALHAFQSSFVKHGGILKDGHTVRTITPGVVVKVNTDRGSFLGKSVVITAGPWTSRLTNPLGMHIPLQPIRVLACYWKQTSPGHDIEDGFPCVTGEETQLSDGTTVGMYTLPADEYPGHVKICIHEGVPIDPDHRDIANKDEMYIEALSKYIRGHYPYLQDRPSILETCIYTLTPDDDFVLDTHPVWKNIVVGAGFSGHGFKMSPVVGSILGNLATGRNPLYDLTAFKMERFLKNTPPSKL